VSPHLVPHLPCENFLYGFKAARRAARAAATARTPPLPLALPLRRRQRRSAGAKAQTLRAAIDLQQLPRLSSGVSMLPLADCPGPGRTRQGRLWPQYNSTRRAAW
jgi:hypothetical protein